MQFLYHVVCQAGQPARPRDVPCPCSNSSSSHVSESLDPAEVKRDLCHLTGGVAPSSPSAAIVLLPNLSLLSFSGPTQLSSTGKLLNSQDFEESHICQRKIQKEILSSAQPSLIFICPLFMWDLPLKAKEM